MLLIASCYFQGCINAYIPHYIISNKSDRLKSVGYIGAHMATAAAHV